MYYPAELCDLILNNCDSSLSSSSYELTVECNDKKSDAYTRDDIRKIHYVKENIQKKKTMLSRIQNLRRQSIKNLRQKEIDEGGGEIMCDLTLSSVEDTSKSKTFSSGVPPELCYYLFDTCYLDLTPDENGTYSATYNDINIAVNMYGFG